MSDSSNASETLARFAVETPAARIPDKVRHEAKRALLNILADRHPRRAPIRPTKCCCSALPTAGQGPATIVGRKERADALNATFLNAAGANIDDFCDTHLPTVIHPTAPIMPPLYALSELQRVRGADLLDAFAIGVEVACRIGNSISPSHYRTRGWHITASCGVFGAAAAAGRLLGLDTQQMVWALGGAAAQASRPGGNAGHADQEPRRRQRRRATACGRRCWRSSGFAGPAQPLEGRFGFFNAVGEAPKWPALLDGLGETWELSINAYKPYPGGVVIHPVIDCRAGTARQGRVQDRRHRPHRWCTAIRCSASAPTGPTSPPAARRRSACSTASPRRRFSATPGSMNTPTPASTIRRCWSCGARSR